MRCSAIRQGTSYELSVSRFCSSLESTLAETRRLGRPSFSALLAASMAAAVPKSSRRCAGLSTVPQPVSRASPGLRRTSTQTRMLRKLGWPRCTRGPKERFVLSDLQRAPHRPGCVGGIRGAFWLLNARLRAGSSSCTLTGRGGTFHSWLQQIINWEFMSRMSSAILRRL